MALGVEELSGEILQGLVDAVAVDGYVHYLDCGDGFSGVCVCQTYQILHFKYMQLIIHLNTPIFLKLYLKMYILLKIFFILYADFIIIF